MESEYESEFNYIDDSANIIQQNVHNTQLKIFDFSTLYWGNYVALYIFYFCILHPPLRFTFYYFIYLARYGYKNFFSIKNEIKKIEEKEEVKNGKKEAKYEDKYLEQYLKLDSQELTIDQLNNLKNSILFDRTPLGNLLMFYDCSRDSFTYYSDNVIPYRFLEVVSRHYVVQNNCKYIHVHMSNELIEAENRLKEKREKERERDEKEKEIQEKEKERERERERQGEKEENKKQVQIPKKNLFAKLKNYNTATSRAATTKNTAPNASGQNKRQMQNPTPRTDERTDIIVKQRANRYSCEGKIANFSFLKKVEKKLVDKRYGMSFSEFKKMNIVT